MPDDKIHDLTDKPTENFNHLQLALNAAEERLAAAKAELEDVEAQKKNLEIKEQKFRAAARALADGIRASKSPSEINARVSAFADRMLSSLQPSDPEP